MNLIRRPAVAGAFYPASADKINKMISEYFSAASVPEEESRLLGIIAPHAGYVYSGGVAAYSYKAIKNPEEIETVIILGPSHRAPFKGISVFPGGKYVTPLGELEIDDETASELIDASDMINYVQEAHAQEHSLEVQLPFIQTVFDDVKIVTCVFGSPDREADSKFVDKAVEIAKKKKVLFVASTDFSHYYNYNVAIRMDRTALDSILKMSEEELRNKYYKKQAELCGIYPTLTLMRIMNRLGGTKAKLLYAANSGDVPMGDKSQVVGYAAVAFYAAGADNKEVKTGSGDEGGDRLTKEEKKKLLEIAEATVREYVTKRRKPDVSGIEAPRLNMHNGAFVTIKKGGQLRGCIGNFTSEQPLYKTIMDMAVSASTQDPRFPPVQEGELERLELEISVLSPLRKITDINEIEVGKHGIYIIKNFYRGVLLPQVATEYGWDRMTFLEQTCRKAGLRKDEWKEGADILIFDAQVFSENDL